MEVAGAMSLSILKNIGEKDGKQTGNLYSSVVEPKTQKNVTITTTVYWAKTSSYVVHTHHVSKSKQGYCYHTDQRTNTCNYSL